MIIGTEIAKMHIVDTVHRHLTTLLTTSNMMQRMTEIPEGMQQLAHGHVSVLRPGLRWGEEGPIHRGNTDRGRGLEIT